MSWPSSADVLEVQLQHPWLGSRRVLEGVTEDEYFWEPADANTGNGLIVDEPGNTVTRHHSVGNGGLVVVLP